MGKPTGFKEFARQVPADRDPLLRILDWNEFHEHMPESALKTQIVAFRFVIPVT